MYHRIGSKLFRLLNHLFEQLVFGAEQTAVPNHLADQRILVGDFGSGGVNRYVLGPWIGRGLIVKHRLRRDARTKQDCEDEGCFVASSVIRSEIMIPVDTVRRAWRSLH